MRLLVALLAALPRDGTGWCGSSCRKGVKKPVSPHLRNTSAAFCPNASHGLYALHAETARDPGAPAGMDFDVGGKAAQICATLHPPLPRTHLCVHPPHLDSIISKGIVWRGHWVNDCNEEYRLRTLCAIVQTFRASDVPIHRRWVLDIGVGCRREWTRPSRRAMQRL